MNLKRLLCLLLILPALAFAQTPPTAFQATGITQPFTANVSGSIPTPVQVTSTNSIFTQYIITNSGAYTVFVSHAPTSAAATANCVVPPSVTYPVVPSGQINITDVPNAYFCGITGAGSSTVYVTPGSGM